MLRRFQEDFSGSDCYHIWKVLAVSGGYYQPTFKNLNTSSFPSTFSFSFNFHARYHSKSIHSTSTGSKQISNQLCNFNLLGILAIGKQRLLTKVCVSLSDGKVRRC